MKKQCYVDKNGLEYKIVPMEQYVILEEEYVRNNSPRYSVRIGALLIRFSELEHSLDVSLCSVLNDRTDEFGYLVISNMNYRQKISLMERLVSTDYCEAFEIMDQAKEIRNCLQGLKSAGEIRNIVAHAKWNSIDNEGYVVSSIGPDKEGKVQYKYYKLTPRILYNLERKIMKYTSRFSNSFLGINLV